MEPLKIFISYAREDIDHVRPIYDTLENAGYDPWMDEKKFFVGQDWEREVNIAIQQSSFFLACLSEKSVNKFGFVQKELKIFTLPGTFFYPNKDMNLTRHYQTFYLFKQPVLNLSIRFKFDIKL